MNIFSNTGLFNHILNRINNAKQEEKIMFAYEKENIKSRTKELTPLPIREKKYEARTLAVFSRMNPTCR